MCAPVGDLSNEVTSKIMSVPILPIVCVINSNAVYTYTRKLMIRKRLELLKG